MAEVKPDIETLAKIKVIGVGGSGGSVVNRMIKKKIRGVEFWAINTDAQALHHSVSPRKLHIGKTVTRGLGSGMNPELGRRAAEESQNEIREALKNSDMVFITCGLGGGTGTGVSPIIAEIAKDSGALTIAVVTKPFSFEGLQRKEIAEKGLEELRQKVDSIIVIPNDKILQIIDKKTSLLDAFAVVDNILYMGVQGIAEIITVPGLINVDFADVKAIMQNTGSALLGIGEASGENRAEKAAKNAIQSPLLDISIEGAKGVLFTISGGEDLTMHEVNEAAMIITERIDENAKIIFGAVINEELKDQFKVAVVATGFESRPLSHPSLKEKETPLHNPYYNENSYLKEKKEEETKKKMKIKREQLFSPSLEKEPNIEEPPKKEEDDELDIPAFIRKKMM